MSGFLLDTCAISELTRKAPNRGFTAWIDTIDEDSIFLSALTIGEIRKGIEKLRTDQQKRELEAWLTTGLRRRFSNRILSFDADIADRWGRLFAQLERSGHNISVSDGIISATALHYNLAVVTRDERDFESYGRPHHQSLDIRLRSTRD